MAKELTGHEIRFLKAVCQDKTYGEIAKDFNKSERTVEWYAASLLTKLNMKSRIGLVVYAIKNGYVTV